MKPIDYIAKYGLDFFNANKGKMITVKLLSNTNIVLSGKFIGVSFDNNNLPLIDGLHIEMPQYKLRFFYKASEESGMIIVTISLLLVDSINDITFSE
jgi:hypothetical protein